MSCPPPTRPGLPRQAPPQVDGAGARDAGGELYPDRAAHGDLVPGQDALRPAHEGLSREIEANGSDYGSSVQPATRTTLCNVYSHKTAF
jgi:hypothetical protein